MRFLIDEQLPPVLGDWLQKRGFEARHVHQSQLGASPDRSIWERAVQTGAVIVSKDEDFAIRRRAIHGPQLVWIRIGNASKRVLLARMDEVWPEVERLLEMGEAIIEVRPSNAP